jgi:hypothetical protein
MESATIPSHRSQDSDDSAVSARLAAVEERLNEITRHLDELHANLLTLLNCKQPDSPRH